MERISLTPNHDNAMAELMAQLITHVLDRVRSDLALLESVGCIATEDLENIVARLPTSAIIDESAAMPTAQVSQPPESSLRLMRKAPPPPPVRCSIVAQPLMAEAKWDYESNDPADLTFKQGDLIEIVEETSPDWWKGRLNGREGLFPSNRCAKVETTTGNTLTQAPGSRRFLSTHRVSNTFSPTTGVNKLGLAPPSVDAEKKDKYGKLKSQMASSGASGLGFGAGAAIGGGLVRAIF
ncbi:unnamed protein product [Rhizoctonia solani]|uniref:SH3 domain-containing protein n=1 Tax=Rhizoctonia solani TaxID=456999 RepID=A0A8H3GMD5_9AGAM|nr:unnamed protein product [Rhizoctonia solani]